MPILDMTLSRPLSMVLMWRFWASSKINRSGRRGSRDYLGVESQIGVDGLGPVAGQGGEALDLQSRPGLNHLTK